MTCFRPGMAMAHSSPALRTQRFSGSDNNYNYVITNFMTDKNALSKIWEMLKNTKSEGSFEYIAALGISQYPGYFIDRAPYIERDFQGQGGSPVECIQITIPCKDLQIPANHGETNDFQKTIMLRIDSTGRLVGASDFFKTRGDVTTTRSGTRDLSHSIPDLKPEQKTEILKRAGSFLQYMADNQSSWDIYRPKNV